MIRASTLKAHGKYAINATNAINSIITVYIIEHDMKRRDK